jgi:hypothetical protein
MRKAASVLSFGVIAVTVAFAAPRYFNVSGAGMGTDPDQSMADSSADNAAQTNLRNACPGELTMSKKIFDQCSQMGSNYVCNVNYTGICKVGN